jgi:photosystem II stability/assembly factor-like uncharacterized protein
MTRIAFPAWRAAALAAATCGLILAPSAISATAGTVKAPAASTSALPASFKAAAMSWLSGSHGWLLGSAACGKNSCADVAATTDGGTAWGQAGQLPVPISNVDTKADTGVSEIRFSSASVGWAFGPQLFRTGNSGRTWAALPVPGHGYQVLALAATADGIYAVVSPCKQYAASCKAKTLSLWRADSPTGQGWTQVAVHLAINDTASLASFAKTLYVVDPGVPGTLEVSTDGQHFSARPSSCDTAEDVGLDQAAPTSATDVSVLCDGNPGISKATKAVNRSVNTGRTFTSAGTTPALGIDAELAASTSGRLLVAAWANGDWMYLNDTGKTRWSTPLALGDGGAGFGDLSFVTSKVAWVVYGPVSAFPAEFGKLYVTRNGGQNWKLVSP